LINPPYNIPIRGLFVSCLVVLLALASLRASAAFEGPPDAAGQLYARQWNAMMARNWSDEEACVSGLGRGCNLAELQTLINGLLGAAVIRQLHEVNRAINRAAYREDRPNWGRGDHWAAPRELLARGGDCEDFAIAKYLALRALRFPARDLHLLILYDIRRQQAHAVLAVTLDGRELVLDNLQGAIRPSSELLHYRVRYALNENGVVSR
jgi:predicted transglutaminase-like cysteine proteinase